MAQSHPRTNVIPYDGMLFEGAELSIEECRYIEPGICTFWKIFNRGLRANCRYPGMMYTE